MNEYLCIMTPTDDMDTCALWLLQTTWTTDVGPCHHGMARPQVVDGGMASYMEGSCE